MPGIIGPGVDPTAPIQKDKLSYADVAAVAMAAGFEGRSLRTAIAVAFAESGGRPRAVNRNSNGSRDRGLWQINTVHPDSDADCFTPSKCARIAYRISSHGSDWSPWVAYKNGAYLAHIAGAETGIRRVNADGGASAYARNKPYLQFSAGPEGGTIGGPIREAAGKVTGVADFLGRLTDTDFLLRMLQVVAGILCLLIGVILLAKRQAFAR